MKPTARGKLLILVLIAVCGFLFVWSQGRLSRAVQTEAAREGDLYLPEAPYLQFISMGHDMLISDLVLAKALTYYGSHYYRRHAFAFKHLKKLFVTALQMDPMNKEAFLMANNTLSGINIRDSIEILEMGMSYHPDYWKFPEMIGFDYFYHLKDPHRAAGYYEKAAGLPGHPPYVSSLSGKFYQESGRYEDALRVLNNFYVTTRDKRLKASFKDYMDVVKKKILLKQFRLNAEITEMSDTLTFQFRPDPDNLQFQFLKSLETLRLVGLKAYDPGSAVKRNRLFAYFQRDFTKHILEGRSVQIIFRRVSGGRLKQDPAGRFQGFVVLNSSRLFQMHAVEDGMFKADPKHFRRAERRKELTEALEKAKKEKRGMYGFPPEEIPLKDVYRHIHRVVRVRYTVRKVESGAGSIFLHSSASRRDRFRAVIPMEHAPAIVSSLGIESFTSLKGREITVTGLAAVSEERIPQMKIYLPEQCITADVEHH